MTDLRLLGRVSEIISKDYYIPQSLKEQERQITEYNCQSSSISVIPPPGPGTVPAVTVYSSTELPVAKTGECDMDMPHMLVLKPCSIKL